MRPFSFTHYDHLGSRRIQVLDLDGESVVYQVYKPGVAVTYSPARVRAETFRQFFSAGLAAAESDIRRQIGV